MTSIFDYTILANLTSVAIVITVYVFFATIKGSEEINKIPPWRIIPQVFDFLKPNK